MVPLVSLPQGILVDSTSFCLILKIKYITYNFFVFFVSIDFVLSLKDESMSRVYESRILSIFESNKEEGNED